MLIHIHIYTYSIICIDVEMYVYVYIYIYTYVYMYIRIERAREIDREMYVCMYACMYMYVYIYIYKNIMSYPIRPFPGRRVAPSTARPDEPPPTAPTSEAYKRGRIKKQKLCLLVLEG